MLDELDVIEEPPRPWVAGNPGFVHPHLPFRICDWQRDYGYFATIAQARAALEAMPAEARAPAAQEEQLAAKFVALWKELAAVRADLSELGVLVQHVTRLGAELARKVQSLEQTERL